LYVIPILSIAVQAGLIVHVIKTGRNMLWIWAIALLPLVGSIAYAAVEVLPEALGGRTARRAKSGVRRMIDPDRALRRASAEVEISGNVDARRRLAEELFERSQYDAAIDVYQGGLKGVFEHDPTCCWIGASAIRQAGLRRGAADARTNDAAQSRFQIDGRAVVVRPHSRGTGRS